MDRYFDNAATTPLDPRVREAMLPFLSERFGNANSIHAWGLEAHDAVERARGQVANLIGAEDPSQIVFTSGATEANNWVLNSAHEILISPFEHSAMREPALLRQGRVLPNEGLRLGSLPRLAVFSDHEANVQMLRELAQEADDPRRARLYRRTIDSLEAYRESLAAGEIAPPPPPLVSIMSVNNEIGAMWDVRNFAQPGDRLHSDITQAVGKVPVTVEGLDFASFSAHKFYGPKGIGALYCKDAPPPPLIVGGEQEGGFRGGTLNVAAIVGMGAAAEIAADEQPQDYAKAEELRQIVLDGLAGLTDWQQVPLSSADLRPPLSPFILSLSFRGLQGESIVLETDRAGYAISAGAACSSRSTEPSHVLTALGIEPEWLRGTVRISFGRFNQKDAAVGLAKKMRSIVDLLRTL